jgi:hypothetical protein
LIKCSSLHLPVEAKEPGYNRKEAQDLELAPLRMSSTTHVSGAAPPVATTPQA